MLQYRLNSFGNQIADIRQLSVISLTEDMAFFVLPQKEFDVFEFLTLPD